MDTSAYLNRHGWRGEGHALHPTGRGIKKPLLVSKKNNFLGIGKPQNNAFADQWWAQAFDNGLKNLDLEKNHDHKSSGSKTLTPLELVSKGGRKWNNLYSSFVRGECLEGTWTSGACEHASILAKSLDVTFERRHRRIGLSDKEDVMMRSRKNLEPIEDSDESTHQSRQGADVHSTAVVLKMRHKKRAKKELFEAVMKNTGTRHKPNDNRLEHKRRHESHDLDELAPKDLSVVKHRRLAENEDLNVQDLSNGHERSKNVTEAPSLSSSNYQKLRTRLKLSKRKKLRKPKSI